MIDIKTLAYKDPLDFTKEERKANRKYWNRMEREQPLLTHFLYNLTDLRIKWRGFLPYVYGLVWKEKEVWNFQAKRYEWVSTYCSGCGELDYSSYPGICEKCREKKELERFENVMKEK